MEQVEEQLRECRSVDVIGVTLVPGQRFGSYGVGKIGPEDANRPSGDQSQRDRGDRKRKVSANLDEQRRRRVRRLGLRRAVVVIVAIVIVAGF